MNFERAIAQITQRKQAGVRYEKEGHGKFRDCILVFRNGKLLFQRFSYGEAASLVFEMWAARVGADGKITWKSENVSYSRKEEAPQHLTDVQNDALYFDGKLSKWLVAAEYKTYSKAGLGGIKMFCMRIWG